VSGVASDEVAELPATDIAEVGCEETSDNDGGSSDVDWKGDVDWNGGIDTTLAGTRILCLDPLPSRLFGLSETLWISVRSSNEGILPDTISTGECDEDDRIESDVSRMTRSRLHRDVELFAIIILPLFDELIDSPQFKEGFNFIFRFFGRGPSSPTVIKEFTNSGVSLTMEGRGHPSF